MRRDKLWTSEEISARVAEERVRYHRTSKEPEVKPSEEELFDLYDAIDK